MDFCVLDIETQKMFSELSARNKIHELKISVVGFYESKTDSYCCFEEHEIPQLEDRLKETDLVIGFNIRGFDLPVLQPYLLTHIDDLPMLDLLEEVKNSRGHRVTLQSLAVATLQEAKSGSGIDAIRLFQEKRMEELKKYCLDDVRITKALFDYGRKNGKLFFRSERDFQTYEIPVDWSDEKIAGFAKKPTAFPTSLF